MKSFFLFLGMVVVSALVLNSCTTMAKKATLPHERQTLPHEQQTLPHERQIAQYPSPTLKDIKGRELKYLIDPAKAGYFAEYGLKTIWKEVQAVAKKEGAAISQKENAPFGLSYSTKVYYDTPQGDLNRKGYTVRITTKYKEGMPASAVLTVKFIDRSNMETVLSSLKGKGKSVCEENVVPGQNGLASYVEKSIKANVDLANPPQTLADFGDLLPQLLKTGISPNTILVGSGAYSVRMKPGYVDLPGLEKPAGISMEAWLPLDGGENAFIYDFSFGYGIDNYYAMKSTHAAAEGILTKVIANLDEKLGLANNGKYSGSKVRYLREGSLDLPAYTGEAIGNLDKLYGILAIPSYIKYYEVDKNDKIILNPYLQVATKKHKAILDPKIGVYNYIINAKGNVGITQEAKHPFGRKYKDGYVRPEDGSKKKSGSKEKFGHASGVGGAPARIGGEILFEEKIGSWVINNKSGRYSKKNIDRTPKQLGFAAKLIQSTVNPSGKPWGPVRFRLAYGPEHLFDKLSNSKDIQYLKPEKKKKPFILVEPAKSLEMRNFKPQETSGKKDGPVVFNDDPS